MSVACRTEDNGQGVKVGEGGVTAEEGLRVGWGES